MSDTALLVIDMTALDYLLSHLDTRRVTMSAEIVTAADRLDWCR